MSITTPPNLESDYVEFRTTQHGGRSLFAARDIPPGTRVHSSPNPFAHVIYRDYRREVCAQCFAYAASDSTLPEVAQSRVWSIKWKPEGCQASTAWFCSEDCKEAWGKDEAGPLQMQMDAILTKAQVASRRRTRKSTNMSSFNSAVEVTQDAIEQAWKHVDELVASKARLAAHCVALDLEDAELDIARFLVSAIVRRHVSERLGSNTEGIVDSDAHRNYTSWSHFLRLQNNELANVRERRYILSAHLRIYAFLCNALPKYLLPYIPTTVRDVLARDTGNAFGIWDGDRRDEMPIHEWSFLHLHFTGCTPNIRKTRQGRTLHFETSRAVSAGEELCISYVDTDQLVEQRQKDLESSWFFRCGCGRCKLEST